MSVITKDLGAVTAYAAAVNRGYTGTKEEFETLMASYATVAQQAAESAQSASSSAQGASQAALSANTAMNNARIAESNAQSAASGAQGYAQSAQQSAQSASQSATDAESAKQTAVDAVDGFAAGAQQALDGVNQAGVNWKSLAEAKALDSEAWAVGQRDGEDVGSSDPAYHNNAKYYAESAATDATTAGDAAQTATIKASEAQASADAAAESASSVSASVTQIETNKQDIADLKEDLSQLNSYTIAGFNLFDIGRLERNKRLSIDTGNAVDYEGYSCTDFIPVTHDYPRVRSSLLPDRLVTYNANKEKIEVHSAYYAQPIESASYIRFCYADATTDYNSLMITYTSEVTNASVNTWATIFPNIGYVSYLADANDATFKSSKMTEQEEITGAYALEPVAKMVNHFMMPDGTVSSSTSNDWEIYAYKVENNAEYIIKTFVNTTTATGTTKTFYAIIDKAISGYINYASDNIIEMSEQMGGSVLGVAYNQRYHERRIRISNPSAKTLIVVHGKLGGAQFPTVVVPVVADKDIKYNLALDDLKDFATVENGVYTFTASFTMRIQNSKFDLPKIVKTRAKCTGGQPTIQFRQGNIYLSNAFDIGSYDEYIDQSWRVPAPTEEHVNVQMIITIPSGATLSFKAFTMMESDKTEKYGYGTQLNAHLGFYGMYPENTMIAFNGAYKNGYPACITVPKLTADNKLICFHDDNSIIRTLRNADGTAISEDRAISSLTYAQILEYDAGRYFNIIYAGEKVPLLSEFFKFCAMTGTKPILSTHPALPTSAWEEMKDLCKKYGILEKLNVKSFTLSILQTAYSVLGDDIDGYTLDTSGVTNYESTIASLVGLGIETKKTVEWDSASVTKEAIEATLNAGCTCAVWNVARMSGARYKELMTFGVTEFTDDYNCNFGLLW